MLDSILHKKIFLFGESDALVALARFLRKKISTSVIIIVDEFLKDTEGFKVHKFENIEFTEAISVIYVEENYKKNFAQKATFISKAITANAEIFTWTLQNLQDFRDLQKQEFNLKQFQLSDLYTAKAPAKSAIQQKNRKLLITGGAGFIGSTLVKYYADSFSEIAIVDRAESALFYLKEELSFLYSKTKFHSVLTDILDLKKMTSIFKGFKPDVVIHAAAYKHVSLLEDELEICIKNNIEASKLVFDLALKYRVEHCIFISTDKAVEPVSNMGISKQWAENLCKFYAQKQSKTRFNILRFGNVLGSTGSVLPLWERQVSWSNSIKVTDPEASRFWITLREVCELSEEVLKANVNGVVFSIPISQTLKIGELQQLFLYNVPTASIKLTGLKIGEKPEEKLVAASEYVIQENEKVMLIKSNINHTNIVEKLMELFHKDIGLKQRQHLFRTAFKI